MVRNETGKALVMIAVWFNRCIFDIFIPYEKTLLCNLILFFSQHFSVGTGYHSTRPGEGGHFSEKGNHGVRPDLIENAEA
jgi:hypothetical protein